MNCYCVSDETECLFQVDQTILYPKALLHHQRTEKNQGGGLFNTYMIKTLLFNIDEKNCLLYLKQFSK